MRWNSDASRGGTRRAPSRPGSSASPANVIHTLGGCKASRLLASLVGPASPGCVVLGRLDSFSYRGSLRPCLARFSLAKGAATSTGEALMEWALALAAVLAVVAVVFVAR